MLFSFDESYIKTTGELLNENVFSDKVALSNIISEIKKGNHRAANGLKNVIYKIYQDSPEALASDLPSISEIIRLTILVGIPAAINPLLGLFTFIADNVIKDKANAKVVDKYIKKYEKEIEKLNVKIFNCKNKTTKKYLQEELNSLENGLSNLENYKSKLEDLDNTLVLKKMKEINNDNISESVNLLINEYFALNEEHRIILFSDEEFLSEGVIDKAKVIKHDVNKKVESMDKWFQDTARTLKYGFQNNKRNEIIEGDFFPKMSKVVKRAIVLGATWAINPAIAVIGAATAFVLSKKGTETQRKKIMRELNNELQLIEEKIKDADSNNDKKQKYELMRLKQKLENNRDKIKRYI